MSIVKAEITEVQIGGISIQGLMNENLEFGVAIPQMVEMDLVPPNRSAKQLQALTGVDFQSHKWQTKLNPKGVNVVTLDDFQRLIRALDRKGVESASFFVDTMLGLSLHQLFCDAFGQKFEAEDRQRWLETRVFTRKEFRLLTDQLQKHGFTDGRQYARYISRFQAKLGIENGTRDELTTEQLVMLQSAQVKITTMMDCGLEPWDALAKFKL